MDCTKAASSQRPFGYWANSASRIRDLRGFVERDGIADLMPTHAELCEAGRNDIAAMIKTYGGCVKLARDGGLEVWHEADIGPAPIANRFRPGFWKIETNRVSELRAFVERQGLNERMPDQCGVGESWPGRYL